MAQGTQTRGPAGSPMNEFKENTTGQFEKMAEKATNQFRSAADQAETIANRVTEQGREVGERMQDVAGNFRGAVDRSVKDQPMATLAFAAIVGFVLGAVWKS